MGPNSDILDTRAVVLTSLGRYKQAIQDLELSVTDNPTASKYFHKADAHLRAGENKNAVEAWEKAEASGLGRDALNRMEFDRYRGDEDQDRSDSWCIGNAGRRLAPGRVSALVLATRFAQPHDHDASTNWPRIDRRLDACCDPDCERQRPGRRHELSTARASTPILPVTPSEAEFAPVARPGTGGGRPANVLFPGAESAAAGPHGRSLQRHGDRRRD